MMMAMPDILKIKRIGMHVRRNIYLTSFPFQPHCLNLRANIGISDTKSQQLKHIISKMMKSIQLEDSTNDGEPAIRAAQKRAFAGVGRPMKPIDCRVSRLNLANLRAEKAAIR
jgi:hypothetical protein